MKVTIRAEFSALDEALSDKVLLILEGIVRALGGGRVTVTPVDPAQSTETAG